MAKSTRQHVFDGMELLPEGLIPFVEERLKASVTGHWQVAVVERVNGLRYNNKSEINWDQQGLLKTMMFFWNDSFRMVLGHPERSYVSELLDVRNKLSHNEKFSYDDAERALDTMRRLLESVGAEEVAEKISASRDTILRTKYAELARNEERRKDDPAERDAQLVQGFPAEESADANADGKRGGTGLHRQSDGVRERAIHPEITPPSIIHNNCDNTLKQEASVIEGRTHHLQCFYSLLSDLEQQLGGARTLSQCDGRMGWPQRGIYFFREPGEIRRDTGSGSRIVQVGTHALKTGSRTKLWTRLSQHRGQASSGGGNHRGSIFRLIVGTALIERDGHAFPTWGNGSSAPRTVRQGEESLEQAVSKVIGAMPFLWLAINDEPAPDSLRGYIERNAIALLSNDGKQPLDPPSGDWLGHFCNRERVRTSGLWNQNHVAEQYDPAFLDSLEHLINDMKDDMEKAL